MCVSSARATEFGQPAENGTRTDVVLVIVGNAHQQTSPSVATTASVHSILTAQDLDHALLAVLTQTLAVTDTDRATLQLFALPTVICARSLDRTGAALLVHGAGSPAAVAVVHTTFALPIVHDDRIGLLAVAWHTAGRDTEPRRSSFRQLADELKTTLMLLRFRAEAERRVRESAILAETASAIAAAADLDASLRALISGMAALTGANRGGVRLLDNPDDLAGSARLYFWNGGDSYTWLHLPATYGPNTIDVLRTGVPTYTPDIRLLDGEGEIVQRIVLQERILSSLIVPLRVVGRVVGTVHADATQAHCFRDAQLKPLQLLADQAGGAVEQARLRAAEREQALAREAVEATLRESEARYRSLVEISPDLIAVHQDGVLRFLNHAGARLCGATDANVLLGRNIADLVRRVEEQPDQPLAQRTASRAGQFVQGEVMRLDGSVTPVEVTGMPLVYDGLPARLTIARDVTERRSLEARLMHQAFHDSLTGLPNRALFAERLTHALKRLTRWPESVAVLYLDVDHFKVVNDSLGHAAGDELLIAVSARLAHCLRESDTLARRGGDEFAILLDDCSGKVGAIQVAERLLKAVERPFELGGGQVVTTISIGIVVPEPTHHDAEHILQDADLAMYRAKARGRSRYEVYNGDMLAEAKARLALEAEFRTALTTNQLTLRYQPIVALATGEIKIAEALVRWQHPTRGLLLPAAFLPIAEETGLIPQVDRWMLRTACHQMSAWRRAKQTTVPRKLCLNVSTQFFHQPSLVDDVRRILEYERVSPNCIALEITEGAVIEATATTIETMQQLKDLGIELLIDDFGVGHSSLNYLKQFPVCALKVDQSFVAGMVANADDLAIVSSVVGMAHALGLLVVAEGVETAEQVQLLRVIDCDFGQGYYFSHPIDALDVAHLLRQARTEDEGTPTVAAAETTWVTGVPLFSAGVRRGSY